MEALVQWSRTAGIKVHPQIDLLASGPYGTQGTALSNIANQTLLCSIPFSACITPRMACDHFDLDFGSICKENLESAVLAAFLLSQQRDSRSCWKPYLSSLPERFQTPLFWDEEDKSWLTGTNLQGEDLKRLARMTEQIEMLRTRLGTSHRLSTKLDEWVWAFAVIFSRSFPSSLIDSSTTTDSHPILLPVLDTFNHKSPHPITWQPDHEQEVLSFISGSPYSAGDEIYNNYGGKSNEEFLMSYGFCIETLESDHVCVKLPSSETRCYITRSDPVPESLLLTIQSALEGAVSDEDSDQSESMLNRHGGRLIILKQLYHAVEAKLEGLRQTAPRTEPNNINQRHAKIYRDGQIELCQLSMTTCLAQVQNILQVNEKAIYTLDHAFADVAFQKAIQTSLEVSDVEQARSSQLESVVMALFFWRQVHQESLMYANHIATEADLSEDEEYNELYDSIYDRLKLAPDVFGGLNKANFAPSWLAELETQWAWDETEPLVWIAPFK